MKKYKPFDMAEYVQLTNAAHRALYLLDCEIITNVAFINADLTTCLQAQAGPVKLPVYGCEAPAQVIQKAVLWLKEQCTPEQEI